MPLSKRVRRFATAGLAAVAALVAIGCPPQPALRSKLSQWESPEQSPFARGPYLLRTKPGSMSVVIKAKLDQPPTVEWWGASGRSDRAVGSSPKNASFELVDDQWVTTLTPLEVGRWYGYRVSSGSHTTEPEVFKAGHKRDGTPFRFGAFGDTRTGHKVHRAVVDALAREHIDFILHTGDMVDVGGLEEQWDLFFQIERPLIRKVPIFPTVGNHDMSAKDFYGTVFLMEDIADGVKYYTQDWGNLRIVAVDSGIECRTGCTQNIYARRALSEGAAKGMLMIIFLHHPPYSSGAHGSNKRLQVAVGELAELYGVELVMAGHDHDYERTKSINGTTYVVASAAGAPIRPVSPNSWTAAVRTEPHYALIDVYKDRMALRAINLEGETFDEVVLTDSPPKGGRSVVAQPR